MTTKEALALPKYNIKKAAKAGTPKSALIFGRPKGGKSVCAASIVDVPGFERVLLIDVEGGAAAVSEWYPEVDILEAPTAELFTNIVNDLLSGDLVEPESGLPYQAVIIDTLDKAQERQLAVFAAMPESTTKTGEVNKYFKWEALKIWTAKMGDLLHMAPFFVIFVAHQDDDKDEDTGKVTTTVMLQGKSKYNFPATPDLVGHFSIRKIEENGAKSNRRVLDFTMSDKIVSGQRYADKLDGAIIDPTMEKIFRKIEPERFSKK